MEFDYKREEENKEHSLISGLGDLANDAIISRNSDYKRKKIYQLGFGKGRLISSTQAMLSFK